MTLDFSRRLRIADVIGVARKKERIALSKKTLSRTRLGNSVLHSYLRSGKQLYGVTTGFGGLQDVTLSPSDRKQLQYNLVRSHCAGVGEPASEEVVRAAMLIRAKTIASGVTGARPAILKALVDLLNNAVIPVVPSQGSLGSSGDLAQMAAIAAVLIGEGEAAFKGKVYSGNVALKKANLSPVTLEEKEGLALANGTAYSSAMAALNCHDALQLYRLAIHAIAFSTAATGYSTEFLDERLQRLHGHSIQIECAQAIRSLIGTRARDGLRQAPYSFRCGPVVLGASLNAIQYAAKSVEDELNGAIDNPLVLPTDGVILSGGNFHGQHVALAMDFLKIAVAELASSSERRFDHLLNYDSLPKFLAGNPGLESGLMVAQYTAASLVSENKVLCHPSSVDSIPVSGGQEDHVSNAATAARHAQQVISNSRYVLCIEILAACRAYELTKRSPPMPLRRLYRSVSHSLSLYTTDTAQTQPIENLYELTKREDVFH